MNERQIAIEAIAEGYHVLQLLAHVDKNQQWVTDSVPLCKLERLARELGYENIYSLHLEASDRKFNEDSWW